MEPVIFRYRARELTGQDIEEIRQTVGLHADKGRSHIPRILCQRWNWVPPNGQVVACLAWASAAFRVKSRDEVIGWNPDTRRRRLHLIANNARFPVLPWVRVKNLASKLLALNCGRLSADWYRRYRHPLLPAETFVDTARFAGTCYKAANWRYVGQTRGSAKRGNAYSRHGQSKAVYLYPLVRRFKRELADDTG